MWIEDGVRSSSSPLCCSCTCFMARYILYCSFFLDCLALCVRFTHISYCTFHFFLFHLLTWVSFLSSSQAYSSILPYESEPIERQTESEEEKESQVSMLFIYRKQTIFHFAAALCVSLSRLPTYIGAMAMEWWLVLVWMVGVIDLWLFRDLFMRFHRH